VLERSEPIFKRWLAEWKSNLAKRGRLIINLSTHRQRSDITLVLQAVGRGEQSASENLLPLVYDELRRLAAARMSSEAAGQTLQPTALVHEAWL
jgi:hypothetical protein